MKHYPDHAPHEAERLRALHILRALGAEGSTLYAIKYLDRIAADVIADLRDCGLIAIHLRRTFTGGQPGEWDHRIVITDAGREAINRRK